ncbi:uncharacterized protein LOC128218222 isoform X1 [Mya arenaria]|uniref:uncharacterized protein LOC128218193 isoform X1 n=1 Tax=Mya arenaria TaxID=6604 RepID=UPI0022E28591|nr:uncharacterized protein LOC128218193 isoform X1 [Mya arenaria]XP_052781790.1 uncharacterized protein LOC128218222 isoform X1 [Mya arenaria]
MLIQCIMFIDVDCLKLIFTLLSISSKGCLTFFRWKTYFIIMTTLVASTVAAPMPRNRPARSTGNISRPCNLYDNGESLVNVPIQTAIGDLVRRAEGARLTSAEIKQYVRNTYISSAALTSHVENDTFLPSEDVILTDQTKIAAVQNPATALKEHYSLLFKLVTHVEYIRTHNEISKQTQEGSLKMRLEELEIEIYRILCDIKIALLGMREDTSNVTTVFEVSQAFKSTGENITNETLRAYVVIKDSEAVMKYLKGIYAAINDAMVSTV